MPKLNRCQKCGSGWISEDPQKEFCDKCYYKYALEAVVSHIMGTPIDSSIMDLRTIVRTIEKFTKNLSPIGPNL